MINYDLIRKNRLKILAVILVISLLGNFYLITKLNNNERSTEIVRGKEYLSYFRTLMYYNNSLNYLVNNEVKHNDAIERELQALSGHSFNLLEHARTYAMLSDKEDQLPNLIWTFALNMQDVTNNLYQDDIRNNIDDLKKFSRTINEIVELENQTRINKGFVEQEMYTLLSPKIEKTMDLYLSNQ